MSKNKVPKVIKDTFYLNWSDPKNYNDLIIKKNSIINNLEKIYNNNIWNLKTQSEELNKKIEYNGVYNGFINKVYLLDYKQKPKITTIIKKDFYDYKYKGDNTDRTETNYINVYKAWVNNIFPSESKSTTLDWVVLNQNEILFKLLEYRNNNNLSLETIRKDINLLMKILKIAVGERSEIVNKYKVLQMALSKIHEHKEQENKINKNESESYVPYKELISLRNKIYEEWENKYENTPLNRFKNPLLRIENIKSLLLTFYTCFPPSRNEALNLVIVNSEKEAKTKEAAIYIKDKNNIWIYYNDIKKNHPPIEFNLNDDVINTYSKKRVDVLIETIIESIAAYPRKYLFINSKNEPYTEKGLQRMLYDLMANKNIGVNSLRSSYASYWLPKLNQNQVQRIAFLMRTSSKMLYSSYLKKSDETNDEDEAPKTIQQTTTPKTVIKLTNEQKEEYNNNRKDYYKQYYESKKEKLLQKAKINDKEKYHVRIVRELNQNKKDFEKMKEETKEKYKIIFDKKKNEYISLINT